MRYQLMESLAKGKQSFTLNSEGADVRGKRGEMTSVAGLDWDFGIINWDAGAAPALLELTRMNALQRFECPDWQQDRCGGWE